MRRCARVRAIGIMVSTSVIVLSIMLAAIGRGTWWGYVIGVVYGGFTMALGSIVASQWWQAAPESSDREGTE